MILKLMGILILSIFLIGCVPTSQQEEITYKELKEENKTKWNEEFEFCNGKCEPKSWHFDEFDRLRYDSQGYYDCMERCLYK